MRPNRDGEQKLFSLFGRFSLIIVFGFTSAAAQSFSEFKKLQSASFTEFKDKQDNEFSKYLQMQWEEYQAYVTPALYKKEKPKNLPAIAEKKTPNVGPNLVINIKKAKKKIQTVQEKKKGYDLSFEFFGSPIGFDIDKRMKNATFYPNTKKGIVNFFSQLAASDYDDILRTLKVTSQEMNLNDWGLYMFVNRLAKSLYSSSDDAKLFSWFIFNKMGYRVRVGLSPSKHVVLLYAIRGTMYSTPNYILNKKRYYVISRYNQKSTGRIYTYAKEYPSAKKVLNFELKSLPKLTKSFDTKQVSFKEYGKTYRFSYRYNRNLIAYMKEYPQVDYQVFFNAPLEYETYSDIAKNLKLYTDNKKASAALNFVLRFVQKAFGYERDNEQFGREKVMFAEETLYYDKSDCEDRAVLYARLVKDLFGISVVGVKYKDHMSTALYVPMRGESVKVAGQRYVIADPTYINASLGQGIPKYRSIIPESFVYVK